MPDEKREDKPTKDTDNTDRSAFLDNSGDIVLDPDISDEGRRGLAKEDGADLRAVEKMAFTEASEAAGIVAGASADEVASAVVPSQGQMDKLQAQSEGNDEAAYEGMANTSKTPTASMPEPDTFGEAIKSETMSDPSAKQPFLKAMQQSDVSVYTGHGQHGNAPDFDHKDKGEGNTWINPEKMEEVEAETSDITRSTHKGIGHVVIGEGEDQYTIELDDAGDWDEPEDRRNEADSDDEEDDEED